MSGPTLVTTGSGRSLAALVPFGVLLILAVGLLALTSWAEGMPPIWRIGRHGWLSGATDGAMLESLSNAAEVVAAVLAIAITVVAIVVELAANRYTHRITQLFVRDPVNFTVIGFFVLTTLQCVWISSTSPETRAAVPALPFGGVGICMAMVTLCLLILLPYFAYVSAFLHPLNVVSRIRLHALREIQRGARRYRRKQRVEAIVCIEELEDVALNAVEHKDRSISMACVDALAQLVQDYAALRPRFCEAWSRIDGNLALDPDFVAMDPIALEEVSEKRLWFEMKVLRQYHTIFVTALNRVRDVCYLIALDTRRIARGTGRDHPELCELAIRFFNSYLRAAINARDLRTGYYVMHHYRQLVEDLLAIGDGERVVRIAQHLRFYGQLAFDQGMPFLLEVVAYDLSLVAEKALENDAPEADALLAVLMRVDKEGESPDQEHSLRGVRRAQVRLAAFLLARGDVSRAKLVYADMEGERPELLGAIRTELLTEERSMYWEVTDRGVNFAYLPPELRSRVDEFFAWFGGSPAPHA